MLSDIEIKKLIKQRKIKITPFSEDQFGPSHYKVHLGKTLLIPKSSKLIDLKDITTKVPYKKIELTNKGYILESQRFILGQTDEMVAMDRDIGVFIDGSSTLARLGISIHQSATALLPGQENHIITLEIYNSGPFRIKIYPGIKVGKLIFFKTLKKNNNFYKETGTYVGQKETTGAKIAGLH